MRRYPPFFATALISSVVVTLLGSQVGELVGVRGAGADSALAQSSLPPVPPRWPSSTLRLGQFDSAGGAAAMRAVAPFQFRYAYLAGDATGTSWADWNPNGQFATLWIRDSINNSMTPAF